MAHPNEDVLRSVYQAMEAKDAEAFMGALADDVRWHAPPGNELSGTHEGKQALGQLFGKVQELTGGSFSVEVHDLFANDEHGVGLVRARAQRGDKTLDEPVVHVFHLAGGKVTEFWAHPHDAEAFNSFFS